MWNTQIHTNVLAYNVQMFAIVTALRLYVGDESNDDNVTRRSDTTTAARARWVDDLVIYTQRSRRCRELTVLGWLGLPGVRTHVLVRK